jgi:hypothetical protein
MLARNLLTRIWLTFKQQRFETIAISIVCIGLTAAALIEAFRLNSINVPLSCLQSWQGAYMVDINGQPVTTASLQCQALATKFFDIRYSTDLSIVGLFTVLAPLIVGIIFGAPLVARELEQGTAPLSWALSGSRRRWLLGKMLAGVVLLVPLMLALGLATNVLEGAKDPGLNPYAAFENYLGRGVIDVFWALAAFAGTVALGTLIGRTLPAVIVALVACFFAYTMLGPLMTHFVLRPMAVEQTQDQSMQGGYWAGNVDLYVYQKMYLDGKPWDGDLQRWWMDHPQVFVDPNATPDPNATIDPNAKPDQGAAKPIDPNAFTPAQPLGPYGVNFVIPGSQYWPITALESGLLLLGALFCGAIALFRVDRRRPY